MNTQKIIQALKIESQTNPVASAAFHLWSLRIRTSAEVTTRTLRLSLKTEGFNYDSRVVGSFLEKLASLGVGRIEKDSRGRVVALKELKLTLQSIANAALKDEPSLRSPQPQRRFADLVKSEPKPVDSPAVVPLNIIMKVKIGGSDVAISIPDSVSDERVIEFLKTLRDIGA